mgnify:CR=1 FL=1
MLLNTYVVPDFVSISKSNDLLDPPPPATRAKLTVAISSNLTCIGGLCTKIKPLSRGYNKPLPALCEHVIPLLPA